MSEEEENVFDKLNRILTNVDGTLKSCVEALEVIAVELYQARRDITKLLEQVNENVGKIAGVPEKPWQPETPAAEEQETQTAVTMPSSKPPWMKKESEEQ